MNTDCHGATVYCAFVCRSEWLGSVMELELELEVSYNDKRCLVERAERRIGATDGTDGDRAVGRGVSVDRHSHARSPTRLLAASVQPSLAKPGQRSLVRSEIPAPHEVMLVANAHPWGTA